MPHTSKQDAVGEREIRAVPFVLKRPILSSLPAKFVFHGDDPQGSLDQRAEMADHLLRKHVIPSNEPVNNLA
jgi:hypothetical protein